MEASSSNAEPANSLAYRLIEESRSHHNPRLDLSNCGLTEIPREVMGFHWLEELIFSPGSYYDYDTRKYITSPNVGPANDIRVIPQGLSRMTNLRTLMILASRTADVDLDVSEIGQLINLKWLIIVNTMLADIRPLANLSQLEKLYIQDNQVNSLVPLAKCATLRVLRFSRNKVTDIKPLAGLKNLRVLRFGKNQVTDISPLAKLDKLENLSFYSNRVSSLLPIKGLTGLRQLNFNNNAVTDIFALDNLTQLEALIARGNHIVSLLPLSALSKLKKLDLGKNDIISILPLYGLSKLTELSLKENNLSDVSPLTDLMQLEELDLSDNQIIDVSALGKLAGIKRLYLKRNDVADVKTLAALGKLEELDLSYTKVKDLTPLEGADRLQKLYLDNTDINLIRPLTKMKGLTKFSCLRCKISDCPADIYESGDPRQLQAYFEALETSQPAAKEPGPADATERVFRVAVPDDGSANVSVTGGPNVSVTRAATSKRDVKLIILGNASTGKTNLVKYLEGGTFTGERKTTHGLEVHRWNPDPARFPALKDITVSIWDFGGQEYYHDAYQLFLSSNAVYVLLWTHESDRNGRLPTLLQDGSDLKELEHFELKYWLDTIHHYTDGWENINLLTVQNKTDMPPGKIRIDQGLHDQFKITESLQISLRCGAAGEAPQKAALNYFLSELEYQLANTADKADVPAYWQQIKDGLHALKHEEPSPFDPYLQKGKGLFLTIGEFAEACEKIIGQPIAEKDATTLPSWLNRGGVVVYFSHIPSMRDRIFVRPKRLVEQLYDVLNSSVLDKGGEFVTTDVRHDAEMREILLEIALHLRLIFPHPVYGEGHYIAPQYLRETHPLEDLYRIAANDAWQSALRFRMPLFYYKKAMLGLLLYFAADKKTVGRYFWKHGILFLRDGQGVLIQGLYGKEEGLGEGAKGGAATGVAGSDGTKGGTGTGVAGVEGAKGGATRGVAGSDGTKGGTGTGVAGVEGAKGGATILVGINRNASNRAALQREIFHRLLVVLNVLPDDGPDGNGDVGQRKVFLGEQLLSPEALNRLDKIDVEVSYDGIHYAKYVEMLRNQKETKVRAVKSTVDLLTKNFESILPFTPPSTKKVFLSYSHRNIAWLARLRTHLAVLRRGKEIESWDDKEILPGDEWDAVIKKNIEEADVYILALSADFVASEYIWRNELGEAIRQYRKRGAILIPILFEPFDLGGLPLVTVEDGSSGNMSIDDFQMIPKLNGTLRAVSLWENEEQALAVVVEGIRTAIRGSGG